MKVMVADRDGRTRFARGAEAPGCAGLVRGANMDRNA